MTRTSLSPLFLFTSTSTLSVPNPPFQESRIGTASTSPTQTGIDISSISAEGYGDLTQSVKFTAPDDGNREDHTVMEITLPKPLAPGDAVRFHLAFHDKFPLSVARSGYKRDFIMGGQWFPKIGI